MVLEILKNISWKCHIIRHFGEHLGSVYIHVSRVLETFSFKKEKKGGKGRDQEVGKYTPSLLFSVNCT
eukprot:c13265_g1_i1 orf=168-371(-)